MLAVVIAAAISLDSPCHVHTESDAPVARGGVPGESYEITDWRGRAVGMPGLWSADGTTTLPRLPAGYYWLTSGRAKVSFAVVPAPESRVLDRESFYGVDSGQSWVSAPGSFACPWNGGDTYRTISDIIRFAGIPHVRERMKWAEVNPMPGSIGYGRYMYNADLLRSRGILVSGMFHDCPRWAGRIRKLPSDLAAVYSFCADASAAFGDRMGDWEFWNEEDIGFAPEPVWDYAAALKAAYLGFKAGRAGVAVLPGAITQDVEGPYVNALFDNDAGKFCDAFNYHTYGAPAGYPRTFSSLRSFLKRRGLGNMPIWVTESGTNLEGHSKTPGADGKTMAHSPEQELVVAEFYPKSQIAMQMEGVTRNYFFVFGAYNEANGAKDWGVLRRDGTVKPVYAAVSTMMRELATARLLGSITVGDGFRAYLFEHADGAQTVVCWAISPVDTQGDGIVGAKPDYAKTLSIPAKDGIYGLSDMCGIRSNVTARNGALSLEVTRFPSYIAGLRGLSPDARPSPKGTATPYSPTEAEDLAVVLRVDLNTNDFEVAGHKSRAILKNRVGRLRLQIWNLDDSSKAGCVEVTGGALAGVPKKIVVGPRGTPPAAIECTFTPQQGAGAFQNLTLTGVFGGRRSSRLVVPVRVENDDYYMVVPTAWRDPANWKRNTSARSYNVAWDEKEQAMRFDVAWPDMLGDRWFYPVYKLHRPQENMNGAKMVRFEVKSSQNKVENDYYYAYLLLAFGDKGKSDKFIPYHPPLETWERRTVDVSDFESLANVKSLHIGGNPKGTQCTFWIRNLEILKSASSSDANSFVSSLNGRELWPGEGLKLRTVGGKFPGQHLVVRDNGGVLDISDASGLVAVLTNKTQKPVTVMMMVQNGSLQGLAPSGSVTMSPGEAGTIECDLNPEPWVLDRPLELVGMSGRPMAEGEKSNCYRLKRVTSFHFYRYEGESPDEFDILSVKLKGETRRRKIFCADSFFPFVDCYGQFMHDEWPGKVHSDADFLRLRDEEERWLSSVESPFVDVDEYGGWAKGPKRKSTGFFRVEKIDGRWWFVDPKGNLFWSSGIDCVHPTGSSYTGVSGREKYFAWLPDRDNSAYRRFWSHWPWKASRGFYSKSENVPFEAVDLAGVNMVRRYGNGWWQKGCELAHRRMKAWGVNTIGNWSERDVCKLRRTPYTLCLDTRGTPRRKGADGKAGPLPDATDPKFGETLRARARKAAAWMKDDPWCLGVFVDNEQAWKSLSDAERVATDYYSTVRRILREELPNHLYFGDRIGWGDPEVYRVASRYCDVVSLNIYSRAPDHDLPDGSEDTPMIIGEFHFGALDRGLFHPGLSPTRNQDERAKCYIDYMRASASRPRIVGAHWFQWKDQPLTGRPDTENFQCGFLDVADTPYPELVGAARKFASEMYNVRMGADVVNATNVNTL